MKKYQDKEEELKKLESTSAEKIWREELNELKQYLEKNWLDNDDAKKTKSKTKSKLKRKAK